MIRIVEKQHEMSELTVEKYYKGVALNRDGIEFSGLFIIVHLVILHSLFIDLT